jgi:hypothetical protein
MSSPWDDDLEAKDERINSLEAQVKEAHEVLDADESMIIRNAKDGYPEGRPDRVLTLAERVKAVCKYGADYKRWCKEAEAKAEQAEKMVAEKQIIIDDLCDKWEELQSQNARLKEALERLKLEFDANVCECGEKWSETDAAVLVNDALRVKK